MKRATVFLAAGICAACLAPAAHAQRDLLRGVGRIGAGAAAGSGEIGIEQEMRIGRNVAATVAGRWRLLANDSLNAYVNMVGTVVAQQSPRIAEVPFRFAVLDTDEINAFATPGGYIFVTRGALEMMENEAELAGVLAHEVAHVDQKHVLEAMRKVNMVDAARSSANLDGFVFDELTSRFASMIFMGLGKPAELESDSLGMAYAAAAGYRADGLLSFVRKLQAGESNPRRSGFLAEMKTTHPPTGERIAALERQLPAATANGAQGQQLADRFRHYVRATPAQQPSSRPARPASGRRP